MAAFIPNIAAGKFARYAMLPETADACIWIVLVSAGLVSDATLRDYDDVTALLGGASDEATFTGYSRQTATSVTVTVDDSNDRTDVDAADPSWSPTSAQALGKIVLVYDGDTGAGTDANVIPLFYDDFVLTTPSTTGSSVAYQVASGGWGRATPS